MIVVVALVVIMLAVVVSWLLFRVEKRDEAALQRRLDEMEKSIKEKGKSE